MVSAKLGVTRVVGPGGPGVLGGRGNPSGLGSRGGSGDPVGVNVPGGRRASGDNGGVLIILTL